MEGADDNNCTTRTYVDYASADATGDGGDAVNGVATAATKGTSVSALTPRSSKQL